MTERYMGGQPFRPIRHSDPRINLLFGADNFTLAIPDPVPNHPGNRRNGDETNLRLIGVS